MGAIKSLAMEVSEAMGRGGELDTEVVSMCEEVARLLSARSTVDTTDNIGDFQRCVEMLTDAADTPAYEIYCKIMAGRKRNGSKGGIVLKEIEKADAKTYDQYALGYGESWLEGTRFGLGLARNFITAEFGLQDEEEPAAEETDRDEVLKVAHGMVKYGGGFILELGHALYHADEDNVCLIKNTWPKYWAEFLAATQAEEAKKKDDGQTD